MTTWMWVLLWVAVGAIASNVLVTVAFFTIASAERAIGAGLKLSRGRYLICEAVAVVGTPADAIDNFFVGSWLFRELPLRWLRGELMYTGRVQWHVDHGTGWRFDLALSEAALLNVVLPGHIKRVDEALARQKAQAW